MTLVGWSLAEDRGDSEKWWGGHWQKTEETVKSGGVITGRRQRRQRKGVGWPLAGDRGDSEKVVGGHWQKTEETVKSGGVVTGRRQWNWWLTTCKTLGNW